ncbi:MAG: hypothetical protein KGY43_04015 [Halodesulfurarchaeum sp.]|nr:hypothetical protein [Halodesulfurarchaeum sp.]
MIPIGPMPLLIGTRHATWPRCSRETRPIIIGDGCSPMCDPREGQSLAVTGPVSAPIGRDPVEGPGDIARGVDAGDSALHVLVGYDPVVRADRRGSEEPGIRLGVDSDGDDVVLAYPTIHVTAVLDPTVMRTVVTIYWRTS